MEREVYGEAFEHEGSRPRPNFVPNKPEGATPPDSKPSRCYCDYCRGRAGIHGAEATALYRAKVAAVRARRDDDEHRSNLRWERPS